MLHVDTQIHMTDSLLLMFYSHKLVCITAQTIKHLVDHLQLSLCRTPDGQATDGALSPTLSFIIIYRYVQVTFLNLFRALIALSQKCDIKCDPSMVTSIVSSSI